MTKTLLVLTAVSFSTFAQAYSIQMTCGEVIKARNGKILKRLEPNLFGINAKFALMTKFVNPIGYTITGSTEDRYTIGGFEAEQKTFTYFSIKNKYQREKAKIKKAIRFAKSDDLILYACVGHVDVTLKYSGSHVYLSTDSVGEAMKKMIKQGARHAW